MALNKNKAADSANLPPTCFMTRDILGDLLIELEFESKWNYEVFHAEFVGCSSLGLRFIVVFYPRRIHRQTEVTILNLLIVLRHIMVANVIHSLAPIERVGVLAGRAFSFS